LDFFDTATPREAAKAASSADENRWTGPGGRVGGSNFGRFVNPDRRRRARAFLACSRPASRHLSHLLNGGVASRRQR
jgi:hypothetical protein